MAKAPPKSPTQLLSFIEGLKKQWVATIDALIDPLAIVSLQYKIIKANKAMARFSGTQDVRSIIGKKCYQVFADRTSPCPNCLMKKVAATKSPISFNLDDVRSKYYFEVNAQPVFNQEDNKLEGVVSIYRDRTEAKALQKNLLQSEKLASIGLLAGGVAHEINNPLGGILIFSQLLLRDMDPKSRHYQDVVEIEAATQRCKEIVTRLLDFARSQPTTTTIKKIPVDVTEAARSALRFACVAKESNKIKIKEKWVNFGGSVLGERNSLIQLFLNLIQNAFHAMPDGGVLSLSCKAHQKGPKKWGVWIIEDTGIGIEKAYLAKIFDPFFTTKEPGMGTGLGLSICYSIAKELGGTLEVDSKLNHGTRFTISLPLIED